MGELTSRLKRAAVLAKTHGALACIVGPRGRMRKIAAAVGHPL